ncbi:MAG TPA: O-antigen ligase family protein [Candidatus Koribacter sp.]
MREQSAAAALPFRAFAFAIAALPTLLSVFFWPTLQSPFLLAKSSLLVAATALLAVPLTFSTRPIARTRWHALLLRLAALFLLLLLISAAFSPQHALAVQPLLFIAAGLLLVPIAAVGLQGRSTWLLRGIAISGVMVAIVAILNRFGFDVFSPFGLQANYVGGRMQIAATLGNPNFVAAYLASSMSAVVYFALRPEAWFWRICLLPMFLALFFAGSHAGLLAFGVMLFTLAMFLPRSGMQSIVIMGFCILVIAFQLRSEQHASRAVSTSLAGRFLIWHVAVHDGLSALGSGPGSFAYIYPARMGRWFHDHPSPKQLAFADPQTHAHNDFVEFFAEAGILGGAAFLVLIALSIFLLLKHGSPYALAGFASLLIAAGADFPLHRAETWALLWLWLSFAFLRDDPHITSSGRFPKAALVGVPAVLCIAILPCLASYEVHEGLAYDAQSADVNAVPHYEQAIRYAPADPDANFYLARALANSGRPTAALAQTQIAQHWMDEPELYELRARIQLQLGERGEAVATVQEGLRRFPYSAGLAALRAELSVPAQ